MAHRPKHNNKETYRQTERQNETEMFSESRQNESVDRSSFSSVGSLFHARGAATEKALSPVRRRVRGTTRLPHDEACSVDRPGILATDVRRSEIPACVTEATCEPASTACTGSSHRLATSATLQELESHGHAA